MKDNKVEVSSNILRLALPMAGTQLITVASGFLCMTMLAKLGHDVLAASALIFSISTSITVIGMSLLFSLSILIGRAFGAHQYLNIGSLMQHGWLIACIISIPLMVIFWYINPILVWFGQDPAITPIVEEYFHANVWRVLPLMLSVCNQQMCYGVHKPKIDMIINLIGVIVLVGSAEIFIFGSLGFWKLGVAGLGYAIALQAWFYFIFTTLIFYFVPYFKKFTLFNLRLHHNWNFLRQIFNIGWPISLQVTGELSSFLVSSLFMGWMGVTVLGAYQVIIQYFFLVIIPIFAISQASGILVGQAYGAKRYNEIRKIVKDTIVLTLCVSGFSAFVFIFSPHLLASFYIKVTDPQNAALVNLIVAMFTIMAISQIFDAIRNVVTGILRGLLDMKFPMLVGLGSIWLINIPISYILAFPLHYGAVGALWGWTVGMVIGAFLILQRWYKINAKLTFKANQY